MCLKSIKQEIYDIRKESLDIFLNSENPEMRKAGQEFLDNPTFHSNFIGFIKLILRPVHRYMMIFLDALLEAQKEQQYQEILDSLSSDDTAEKIKAIQELAEYPNKETNQIIVDQLMNGPKATQMASVEALWEMGLKDAIEPLKETLKKETECFTRIMISLCLMSLGDTNSFATIFDDIAENSIHNDHWDMTDLFYSGIYPELGKKAIPFLENGLRHPDWHVRWISLRVIESAIDDYTQSKKALGKYSFLNEDPEVEVREIYKELVN